MLDTPLSESPLVLIADDDTNMRLLTRAALEPAGFEVAEAEDGVEALSLSESLAPEIVLLDVVMPGPDGFETCAVLRQRPGGESTPIVMLTALEDMKSISRAYEVGATDFLTKPINWIILSQRVRYMVHASRMANELRKSEAKNQAILHAIPDSMFRIGRNGVFREVKRARDMEPMLPADQFLGKPMWEVLPEDVSRKSMEHLQRALQSGGIEHFEYELDNQGSLAYYEAHMVANGDDEVLCMVRNIVGHRKMEAELLQARKLEAVGILAGGIAHDFNNLLTVIMGNISMARTDVHPETPCYRRLTNAEQATLRASDLTKQFLSFSTGEAPLKRPVILKELVADSVCKILGDSDVMCEYCFPGDLWKVEVDSSQMKLVLQNLVIKAKEAIQNGGFMEIEARNVHVGPGSDATGLKMREGPYVRISIKEKGIGILMENVEQIFDPYPFTKQRSCQKGMGLAIAHSILKHHDGYLTIESGANAGSVFHLYLPAVKADSSDP